MLGVEFETVSVLQQPVDCSKSSVRWHQTGVGQQVFVKYGVESL